MSNKYSEAKGILLNNGSQQLLPVSMSNLIELAANKTAFGEKAQSVQDALTYIAGAFAHANNAAKTAQDNAYAYVGQEINNLDVTAVGSATDKGHDKFISYIYQENGYIHAFARDMNATNVAYSGGLGGRATVADELAYINATIANNLTATTLKLVHTVGADENVVAESVSADGTEYRLKQGEHVVAKFNIEKDSFVKSGSVVRGTADESGNFTGEDPSGKYFIKLEIRTNDEGGDAKRTLYIPAESLVDAYTAKNDGNNVTITVDQDKNTISAKINAGGVGTTELAASAVTAAKIADKNVTQTKLADNVQASLAKADTAVQKITESSTAGAINVDDTVVLVHGLANVATTGAAANVTVAEIANLDALSALGEGKHVDDVQEALEVLAGKVKAINDGAVTSVKASVAATGKDTQKAVAISMEPTQASMGAVEVKLSHNLGSAAVLDYDMKTVATPVSQAFWESVK